MTILPVLLLALTMASPQQHTSQHDRQAGAAQPQQRGSDSLPVTVKLLNTGQSEHEAAQEAARVRAEESIALSTLRWTRALGVATIVLAVVTLLLWYATRAMANDAKASGLVQASRMEESVRQAIRSADAMEASVREGRATAERQLRAYVGVAGDTMPELPSANHPFAMAVKIRNFGETPAYNVRCTFFWALTRMPHTAADTGPTSTSDDIDESGFILEPTASQRLSSREAGRVNAAEAEAIRTGHVPGVEGEVRLNIRGTITFVDAFGVERTRHYCHFYGGSGGVHTTYCPIHNTAD